VKFDLFIVFFLFIFTSCVNNEVGVKKHVSNTVMPSDSSFGVTVEMAKVLGGNYIPLYGRDSQIVKINDFYMDVYPVTNANYLAFVKKNSRWRKSNAKKIFIDNNYLFYWLNDTTLDVNMHDSSPVTNVSWFAANAYCNCQGKRLATVDEWEFVAMANTKVPDARKLETYNQFILDWYEKPKTSKNKIGNTFKNYWGVYDMHGLVWEWTSDFSSVLLTGESRSDVKTDENLFCGSGSLNTTDLMNYAAFMRYAFRGSIKANYSIQNLGFRCVSDSLNF
jgi:formylglycine-generating enzyme required for sulfatase activity